LLCEAGEAAGDELELEVTVVLADSSVAPLLATKLSVLVDRLILLAGGTAELLPIGFGPSPDDAPGPGDGRLRDPPPETTTEAAGLVRSTGRGFGPAGLDLSAPGVRRGLPTAGLDWPRDAEATAARLGGVCCCLGAPPLTMSDRVLLLSTPSCGGASG